ncbi:uncharacterized protein [Montipora capricornis]|uniref:uncharacterized protein n=1 Tax=Montipora capricornis TaxID=246305 RepID=UPI0035F16ED1
MFETRKKQSDNKVNNKLANECMSKWVKNCSDRILSDPELSVLKKGLNFAVTPRRVPIVDIVTVTESACRQLNNSDSINLTAKVLNLLEHNDKVKDQNVSDEERKAIDDLKKDDSIMILPADKGRVSVVLNKKEYHTKCQAILSDTKTYKKLKADPTSRYKNEFATALRDLKDRKVIDYALHSKLYPTCDQPPRFYGLPKIHKVNCPLRPIVSSIGTISYQIARYVADILSPLVGKTEHHVENSKAFAEEVRTLQVAPDEELRSYDVSALFTSVPVDKTLVLIPKKLEEDEILKIRTPMAPKDVVTLLGLCLNCTYVLYQGQFYQQIPGAAMGSPVSPIVCNLYMEDFEQKAIATAVHPPTWWRRYVDVSHTKLKKAYAQGFTDHLISIDDDIKWTIEGEVETHSEDNNMERALAFLDTWSVINEDGTIKTRVYRKATHTDLYLKFESNHPLEHKRGVARTLAHRAESIVSDLKDREGEIDHVRTALSYNGYPSWLLKDPKQPAEEQQPSSQAATLPSSGTSKTKYPVVMPYIRGFSEES